MTANFDTKHLLKKLRSLFRKLYSTCFVFVATDCFDRYTWCHLVPQHKVCDHEFYGTHCCLSCKGHRWCLIWCSTTTIQIFTVIRKPLCVPLPLHSHLEVQWRRPVEICPKSSVLHNPTSCPRHCWFCGSLSADPGHTQCPQHNFWHYFQGKQWMQVSDTAGDVLPQ